MLLAKLAFRNLRLLLMKLRLDGGSVLILNLICALWLILRRLAGLDRKHALALCDTAVVFNQVFKNNDAVVVDIAVGVAVL